MTAAARGRDRLVVGFLMSWTAQQSARIRALCPPESELVFLSPESPEAGSLARLDVLVVGTEPVPRDVLDGAPRLRLIQRWGTGFDNVDPALVQARGLDTAELPGVNARSVSEFILLATLALLRHLPEMVSAWERGEWRPGRAGIAPRRLQGKTIGLIGFGAIGRDLAGLLRPFEVEILFFDRIVEPLPGIQARPVEKAELLARSDIVTVQLPLTDATRGTIGPGEIAAMKRSALLVSVSRPGVVDEAAVRAAVSEGRLAGASFDNHSAEPLPPQAMTRQEGILATPHVGGASIEGFEALIRACFASIEQRCRTR